MNFVQFKNSIDNEVNKENVVAVKQENVAVKQEIPVVNEGNMAKKGKKAIPYEQFVEYDRLTEEKLQKLQRENEELKKENEKLKDEKIDINLWKEALIEVVEEKKLWNKRYEEVKKVLNIQNELAKATFN